MIIQPSTGKRRKGPRFHCPAPALLSIRAASLFSAAKANADAALPRLSRAFASAPAASSKSNVDLYSGAAYIRAVLPWLSRALTSGPGL